jgi:hypothetical protein
MAQRSTVDDLPNKLTNETAEKLRWYMLPREAHELLLGHSQNVKHSVPFDPNKLTEPPSFINHLLYHRTNSLSALDVKRYQKSRSLPDSPQTTKISLSPPPKCASPIPKNSHPLEFVSPPSPIVRFTLGKFDLNFVSFHPLEILFLSFKNFSSLVVTFTINSINLTLLSVGGEVKCAMTSFSPTPTHNLAASDSLPSRNR